MLRQFFRLNLVLGAVPAPQQLMESPARSVSGVPVTEQEWQAIQEWAKNPTFLDWRAPWAPNNKVLKLPEAWLAALNRNSQRQLSTGENLWKVVTLDDTRRQQRLSVLKRELVQHRKRVEQAQRAADLEHELDNLLLHGAIGATNPHEHDRVIAALSFEDRKFGKDEIEETQPFPRDMQQRGGGAVHLRYIDDAKSAADSYTSGAPGTTAPARSRRFR